MKPEARWQDIRAIPILHAFYVIQNLMYLPWASRCTTLCYVCVGPEWLLCPTVFSALRLYALCPGRQKWFIAAITLILSLVPLVINMLVGCSNSSHSTLTSLIAFPFQRPTFTSLSIWAIRVETLLPWILYQKAWTWGQWTYCSLHILYPVSDYTDQRCRSRSRSAMVWYNLLNFFPP